MATTQSTASRVTGLLLGILAGSGLAAIGYLRVVPAPLAPGDWLLLVRDEQGAPCWSAAGRLFAWCVEALGLWTLAPAWQRAIGFAGAWLGVLGAALVLSRLARPGGLAVVATLASLALLPWARDDASELASAGRAYAPGLAMLALLVPGPRRALLAGLVLGALAGSLSAPGLAVGEGLLVVALGQALDRRGTGACAAVAFVAASWLGARLGQAQVVPPSELWWHDLDLASPLPAAWLEAVLLACLALVWWVPDRLRSLAGVLALALALGIAGLGMSRFLTRQVALDRDLTSFGRDAAATVFVNLPGHVRGYALNLLVAARERDQKLVLSALDSGGQLDIPVMPGWPPADWTPSDAWSGPPVRRWTSRGFVQITWRDCLESEPMPPVVLAADAAARLLPHRMLAGGQLSLPAGLQAVRVADRGVRLTGVVSGAVTLAVALLPQRPVRTFADPEFLSGLRPGWFDPPWPEVRLSGPGASRLRAKGWAPGFGPVFEVAPGSEPLDCTIGLATGST